MKTNKTLIISILVILLITAGAGYYILVANNSTASNEANVTSTEPVQEIIPTIDPVDLGVKLSLRSDKRAVKFEIANIKDITSVDYEVTYLAQGTIPRGMIGTIEVQPGDKKIETKYLDLGSCSSGKCKYDEGVTSIKLVLKISKSDGNTYSSEKSLDLSE